MGASGESSNVLFGDMCPSPHARLHSTSRDTEGRMMPYSGSSGRTGKGFGSGWVTSGGLGGGFGGDSTRDRVSGGEDCTRETSDCSGKDWSVNAESEVPSTGSRRRAGGRDLVVREGTVTTAGGYLERSSLCTHSCNRACQIVLPVPLGEHL